MPASVLYVIDQATAKPRPLRLATASGVLSVDASGHTIPVSGTFFQATQPVSAASLPLPSGASTAANQATGNSALADIKTAVEGTLAISATSLPLPTGAATEASLSGLATQATLANVKSDTAILAACENGGNAIQVDIQADATGLANQTKQDDIKTAIDNVDTTLSGTLTTTSAVSKNFASLSNAVSASAGDFSSSHDISNYRFLVIAGTSSASDNIELHVSNDNSTFYKHGEKQAYPMSDGSFSISMDNAPFKYYKLKYVAAGTYTAVGFASN